MTSKTKKILAAALELPAPEREVLAGRLFDSLEKNEPDAEIAWQAEIERRLADLDHGKVKPIAWAKAKRMIFGDEDDSA
jgi:putative addiction module component (TIGR02574 family)